MSAYPDDIPDFLNPSTEHVVRSEAVRQGVDPDLAARMMRQESGGKQRAVSPKGARGVMQLMPGTARSLGVDSFDPYQNIEGGVRYLKTQLKTFGSPQLGAAAYNAGPGAVKRAGGVPRIAETQGYVKNVAPATSVDDDGLPDFLSGLDAPRSTGVNITSGKPVTVNLGGGGEFHIPSGGFKHTPAEEIAIAHGSERPFVAKPRKPTSSKAPLNVNRMEPMSNEDVFQTANVGGETTEVERAHAREQVDYLRSLPEGQRRAAAESFIQRGEHLSDETQALPGVHGDSRARLGETILAPLKGAAGRILSGIGAEAETIAPALGYGNDYHSGLSRVGANLQESGRQSAERGYQGPVARFAQGVTSTVAMLPAGLLTFVMDAYLESRGSGEDHAAALKHAATTAVGIYAGGKLSKAFEAQVEGTVSKYLARSGGLATGLTGASVLAGEPQDLEKLGHTAAMSLGFGLAGHGADRLVNSKAFRRAPTAPEVTRMSDGPQDGSGIETSRREMFDIVDSVTPDTYDHMAATLDNAIGAARHALRLTPSNQESQTLQTLTEARSRLETKKADARKVDFGLAHHSNYQPREVDGKFVEGPPVSKLTRAGQIDAIPEAQDTTHEATSGFETAAAPEVIQQASPAGSPPPISTPDAEAPVNKPIDRSITEAVTGSARPSVPVEPEPKEAWQANSEQVDRAIARFQERGKIGRKWFQSEKPIKLTSDGMLKVVHYSKEMELEPQDMESVPGYGHGLFVYPEGMETEWTDRERHEMFIDPRYVKHEQSFAADEILGQPASVELFIPAENYKYLAQSSRGAAENSKPIETGKKESTILEPSKKETAEVDLSSGAQTENEAGIRKQPWQQSYKEWLGANPELETMVKWKKGKGPQDVHRDYVNEALWKNKSVPPSVLAEYPELIAEHGLEKQPPSARAVHDVRAQMKGVKDGETRTVVDNVMPQKPTNEPAEPPARTKLDMVLDTVQSGQHNEVKIYIRGFTSEQKQRVIDTAQARGLDAVSNGQYVLVVKRATERPLTAEGLTSYRYQSRPGGEFVMIGSRDVSNALNEAKRSISDPKHQLDVKNLEVWDGQKYVPAERTTLPGPSPSTETPELVHHSELQPRDESGHFDGPPEGYTPKTEPAEPVKQPVTGIKNATVAEQESALPKRIGKQERSLPKTLEEANLPGGIDRTYDPVSNKSSLDKAQQNIKDKGLDGAAEWIKATKDPSAEHTATGIAVIHQLQEAADKAMGTERDDLSNRAIDVASELSKRLTESGQAIQAVNVINALSPERALLVAQRTAEKAGSRLTAPEARSIKAVTERAQKAEAENRASQKTIDDLMRQSALTKQARRPKINDLQTRLKAGADEAYASLKPYLQGKKLGSGGEQIALLAKYGAYKLAEKGVSLADWTAHMVETFGDWVKPHLEQVRRDAYGIVRENRKQAYLERAKSDPEERTTALHDIRREIQQSDVEAKDAQRNAARIRKGELTQAERDQRAVAQIQKGIADRSLAEGYDQQAREARRKTADAKSVERIIADIEAKGQREETAQAKARERAGAKWDANIKSVAFEARKAPNPTPDDLAAIGAARLVDKPYLTPRQFYADMARDYGTSKQAGEDAFKAAYQKVQDAKAANRELQKIRTTTGGEYGAMTEEQVQGALANRIRTQREHRDARFAQAEEFNRLNWRLKTKTEKALAYGAAVFRAGVLSGAKVVGKIGSALAHRVIRTPIEEATGLIWKRVFPDTAKEAPTQGRGFFPKAEKEAIKGLGKGIVESVKTIKNIPHFVMTGEGGQTALEEQLGKPAYPVIPTKIGRALTIPGQIHGAEKNPLKHSEYDRRLTHYNDWAEHHGLDPNDSGVKAVGEDLAWESAHEVILMGDNPFSQALGRAESGWSDSARSISRIFQPVRRVPPNYLIQTIAEYGIGIERGVIRGLLERNPERLAKMTPAEVDKTMRLLKRGTVGLLYEIAAATAGSAVFGGYYKRGRKDEKDKPHPGDIKIGSVTIPHLLAHDPTNELAQVVATVRRNMDDAAKANKTKPKAERESMGTAAIGGVFTAGKGLARQVPFWGQGMEAYDAAESDKSAEKFLGRLVTAWLEPQIIRETGQMIDRQNATGKKTRLPWEGESVKRNPQTFGETLQEGIPFAREGLKPKLPKRAGGFVSP